MTSTRDARAPGISDARTAATTSTAADARIGATPGISISTIYYSGNTSSQDQPTYTSYLAGLVTGSGVALVAPTASQINTAYNGFCATIPSAIRTAM